MNYRRKTIKQVEKRIEEMPFKKELALCYLIEDVFNNNEFQALREFLSDQSEYPPQQCNKPFLNKFNQLAHKEMDKNQFLNVSLLLKVLQKFCKEDCDGLNDLIKHGLIKKMLLWFERAMEFLKITELKSNESLVILVEDIFDTIIAICKYSNEGRIELVDSFLLQIGNGVTDFRLKINIRLEAIRTFNSLLDLIFKKGNIKFHSSEEVQDLMLDLAKTILEVGDYEIQVAISEALCRMSDGKMRETFVYKWFSEPIADAFMQIKDFEFETDCRKFLNQLNASLINKTRVYTYPCNSAFLDLNELKKPADDKLENFWIDFNLGSRSVSFFIKDDAQGDETDLWETVSLSYDEVKSFTVEEVRSAAILIINLKKTLLVNKKEGKKVKIYFDSTFDILNVAKLVYGEEMLLTLELQHLALPSEDPQLDTMDTAAEEMNHGENPTASEGELERKISLGQHEEQRYNDAEREHKSLKAVSPLMETEPDVKQNPMAVDTEMETSDIQHNLTVQPERTKSNLLESVFDFETSSDSAEKLQISERKRKILWKRNSQTDEKKYAKTAASKGRSRSEKVKHRKGDRKKIFTEDSYSEGSEHSWLSMPQNKNFPCIADYSKQKKRKSSVLRVLPLFLESSESKEQKEREVTLSKEFPIPSEEGNIPLTEQATSEFTDFQASDTSKVKKIKTPEFSSGINLDLLTPPVSHQKMMSQVIKIARGTSAKGQIPANEGTPGDVGQQSATSPFIGYYNDSINMDEELGKMEQNAERSNEVEDGSLHDGNLSASLHGFTEGMKQELRFCYRNMEQYTRQSRQSTEKFSTLMRQIHTYRLQKLSMYKSIIDNNLKDLEEDVQTLKNLEENFNHWKQQSMMLSQFYEKWQQRMSMLIASQKINQEYPNEYDLP